MVYFYKLWFGWRMVSLALIPNLLISMQTLAKSTKSNTCVSTTMQVFLNQQKLVPTKINESTVSENFYIMFQNFGIIYYYIFKSSILEHLHYITSLVIVGWRACISSNSLVYHGIIWFHLYRYIFQNIRKHLIEICTPNN